MTTVKRQDNISNALTGLGGEDDPGVWSRPSLLTRLDDSECEVLYLLNDLARRIVDEIVDDALKNGYEPKDADSGDPVELDDKKLERLFHKRLSTTCKNGRIFGVGGLFMINEQGAKDFSKELDYSEELPTNFLALDKREISTSEYVDDVTDPRFGKGKTYYVSPSNIGVALNAPRVHHSRILFFGGASLPERMKVQYNDEWDDSVYQAVWGPLRRFGDVENAIAAIVQRFDTAKFSIAGLAEILQSDGGAAKILERIQLVNKTVSSTNAVVVDAELEDYTRQFASLNGLDTIWDRLAHSVSKAARMPMTQLFGMSPSGLATDDNSGRANWRKQVAAYQQDVLLEPLVHFWTWVNGGEEVTIEFAPLDEATAKEEAEVNKLIAETRAVYVQSQIADADEFRQALEHEGHISDAENGRPDEEPVLEEFGYGGDPAEEANPALPEGPDGQGGPAPDVPEPEGDEEGVPSGESRTGDEDR